jgi:hypothetical protein
MVAKMNDESGGSRNSGSGSGSGRGSGTMTAKASTTTSSTSGSGTVQHSGQSRGIGWAGGTVCVGPYTCTYSNAWYLQCL